MLSFLRRPRTQEVSRENVNIWLLFFNVGHFVTSADKFRQKEFSLTCRLVSMKKTTAMSNFTKKMRRQTKPATITDMRRTISVRNSGDGHFEATA